MSCAAIARDASRRGPREAAAADRLAVEASNAYCPAHSAGIEALINDGGLDDPDNNLR